MIPVRWLPIQQFVPAVVLLVFVATGCEVQDGLPGDILVSDGIPELQTDLVNPDADDAFGERDRPEMGPGDSVEPGDSSIGDLPDDDVPTAAACLIGSFCDDDMQCPGDSCDSRADCGYELLPGWCHVGTSCIADGQSLPGNPCLTCQTALATDRLFPDDTGECDDGDVCTRDDRCSSGLCVGKPLSCDDGNPCTQGRCEPGTGCIQVSIQGPCDDGDLCTVNDSCIDGQCIGLAVDCDNGNQCTQGDWCLDGRCVPGSLVDCDDGNPCTNDSCVPTKGCVHIPNAADCDDGNPCTIDDTCYRGNCIPGTGILQCDDGNPCTDDSCDPVSGCTHSFNTGYCDDGDPCTTGDYCLDGVCLPGVGLLDCNDGNPCTANTCEPGVGCFTITREGQCDDGDPCTVGDECSDGTCLPGAGRPDCDDGNRCTLDSCRPGVGCTSIPTTVDETCGVEVLLDSPERATTLSGEPEFVVIGQVRSLAGWPLAGAVLKVEDAAYPLFPDQDGNFRLPVPASHGMNLIELSATDIHGSGDATSRTLYHSRQWLAPEASSGAGVANLVAGGLKAFMSESAVDDVDPSVPDIAALLERFLPLVDPMSFLSNPVAVGTMGQCGYDLHLMSLEFADAQVNLLPWDHEIIMDLTLHNLTGLVKLGMDGGEGCHGLDEALLSASSIQIALRLAVHVDSPGVVQVELPFRAAWVSPDLALYPCEPYCDVVGFMGPVLESQIKTMLTAELVPAIESALAAIHSAVLPIPPIAAGFPSASLRMDAQVSSLEIQPSGLHATGGAGFLAPGAVRGSSLGSIMRGSCNKEASFDWFLPGESPIEIGFADDLVNRALHALWQGGMFDGRLTGETLATLGVDISEYGISNLGLDLKPLLPPIMTDCRVGSGVLFEWGDVEVLADFNFAGLNVVARLWLGARVPADISPVISDDGQLQIAMVLGEPRLLSFDIGEAHGSPGVGRSLVTHLMALLLGEVGPKIAGASFAIPDLTVDLSTLSDMFPPGTNVSVTKDRIRRIDGATVLGFLPPRFAETQADPL